MKKTKVIKWTIIYSLIYAILFAVYIGIETTCVVNNSTFIEANEEGDISYQSVNSKNESNIIIWNSEIATDKVVRVDEGKKRFEIIDDTYCKDKIYFQYSYYSKKNREVFGVGVYDLQSKQVDLSDMKGLEGYQWESICEKDDKVYMLLNDIENKLVKEYRLETKGKLTGELVQEYPYHEGNYILDAIYYNGRVYMCQDDGITYYYNDMKVVKDDIDKASFSKGNYTLNKNASKLFELNVLGDVLIDKLLIGLLAYLITGAVVISLVLSRAFVLKLMIWTELGFMIITSIIIAGVGNRIEKNEIDRIVEYGTDQLENIPNVLNASEKIDYQKLYDFNKQLDNVFEDVIVVNKEEGEIELVGALAITSDSELPSKYLNLTKRVKDEEFKRIKSGNTEYMAIAISEKSDVKSQSVVIGIIELSDVRENVSQIMDDISDRTIVLFIIINAVIIGIFIYYAIAYGKFANALLNMVKKHDNYENVKKSSKDLVREFSALDEINRIFTNVRYEKNQNFELYNRFIPKEVEKILGRQSLLDVELGDSVEITGSVATISIDDDNFVSSEMFMHTIENAYEIMDANRKKQNGIIVSQDSRMSDTKILFKDDLNDAIEFAIDTIHGFDSNINVADKQKLIVINYSNYQCGITGCEERLIPYLFSKEETIVMNYVESFRRAGIKLILTEQAVERANKKFTFRYIGYITEKGRNIKIYECLDAYSQVKKNLLVSTQAKLKKALGLFYSNDFYLARNTFNEVLKENPDDKIARWYLFNCESNLNNINEDETSYGLFENKIFEQQYQI